MRSFFLSVGSQGLSSVSNFGLVVVVARSTAPEGFGAFAIGYSLTLLSLATVRGSVGETHSVTRSGHRDGEALGASLILGLSVGSILLCMGLLWSETELKDWLLLFGLGMPVLALQDACRFVGFASARPQIALLSDAVWLGGQLAGWLLLARIELVSGTFLLIVWWVGAGIAAIVVLGRTGVPRIRGGVQWLRVRFRTAGTFGIESLVASGSSQMAVYALGLVVGLPAAGALRAAQSLYGPVRSVAGGVRAVALPEAAKRWDEGGQGSLLRYSAGVAGGLFGIGVVALAFWLLIPSDLGRAVLDETWSLAEIVMPAVGAGLLSGMIMTGAQLALRARQMNSAILVLRSAAVSLTVLLGVGGALAGGLLWSAWGLAIAQLGTAVLGWWIVTSSLEEEGSPTLSPRPQEAPSDG